MIYSVPRCYQQHFDIQRNDSILNFISEVDCGTQYMKQPVTRIYHYILCADHEFHIAGKLLARHLARAGVLVQYYKD